MISAPTPAYSMAERLADLDRLAADLHAERGGGWLARSIADAIVAEIDSRAAAPTVAQHIEGLLTSGLIGERLNRELWARFGAASRAEVFAGVAAAVTILAAHAQLAELETVVRFVEREAA